MYKECASRAELLFLVACLKFLLPLPSPSTDLNALQILQGKSSEQQLEKCCVAVSDEEGYGWGSRSEIKREKEKGEGRKEFFKHLRDRKRYTVQ